MTAAHSWLAAFLRQYDALDRLLVAAGWPATSAWWRRQIERFLVSGRRTFVLRVGRRGGKSSTLCRVAVAWALWGQYAIPPGDVGVVAFVSVSRDESAQRLRTIEAILRALGVGHRRQADNIELDDRPVVFRTFAASIAGVSGFTAILFIADEVAKWRDSDTGANPATEVLASARPTMATQPSARMFLCSSPLGTVDAHAVAFEAGDTDAQLVAHAPTWEANPTVSEADTRELEPDEETRQREYGAIPSASESTAFVNTDVPPCFALRRERYIRREPVLACDPASSGNTFAYLIAQWCDPDPAIEYERLVPPPESGLLPDTFVGWRLDAHGQRIPLPRATRPVLYISEIGGWTGEELRETTMDRVAAELAWVARSHGAKIAFTDSFGDAFLAALLSQHGLRTRSFHQSQPSKHEAVMFLRSLMRDRQLVICEHDGMRRDLLTYPRRITGSGFSYGTRRAGHHWDYASALVILAHSMTTEHVGTPTDQQSYRIDGSIARKTIGGRHILPGR